MEGIQYCWEITSVHAGDNISTVGDNISTVEGSQYSGGTILISECLVIDVFVLRYEIFISIGSFRKFKQISCLLIDGLVYSRSNIVSK